MIKLSATKRHSIGYHGKTSVLQDHEFNDGSVNVQIPEDIINFIKYSSSITISARLHTPADQMRLPMVAAAIRNIKPDAKIHLFMPFTPYGRQDDTFLPGQVNAMKVWAEFINSLNFASVLTLDAHSIAVNMVNRVKAIHITEILNDHPQMRSLLTSDITLVSPDAGANKKCHKIAQKFGITKMVRADKARDLATGNIIETELFGTVKDEVCVIVDDICDGGMTFIKLAEKLKAEGAKKVVLFVTHGLFTKGLEVFDGLIDEIYTTNSICKYSTEVKNDRLEIREIDHYEPSTV